MFRSPADEDAVVVEFVEAAAVTVSVTLTVGVAVDGREMLIAPALFAITAAVTVAAAPRSAVTIGTIQADRPSRFDDLSGVVFLADMEGLSHVVLKNRQH